MPNITSVLNDQIRRLAKREIKANTGVIRKATTQYRHAIAALKKQVAALTNRLPRPPLTPWRCRSCGQTKHRASIQIQTEGEEDFVGETDGAVDAARWPDGFGWFSMSIKCATCGMETPEGVSYEAM